MTSKLYIGNLSYNTTEDLLADYFSQAGNIVNATIIIDRDSGRSKGFGFVEFSNEEEAQKAIEMFHEQEFEGRNLIVNEAIPRKPREFKSRDNYKRNDWKKDSRKKKERERY